MEPPQRSKFIIRIDLDVEVTDAKALERCALAKLEQSEFEPGGLEEAREEVREGPESAVMVSVEPHRMFDGIDGVEYTGDVMEALPAENGSPVRVRMADRPRSIEENRQQGVDRLFRYAELATGLDLELLGYDDELPELDRRRSEKQAKLLAGCLWNASAVVIDELFMDIQRLSKLKSVTAKDISLTFVLAGLPERFAHRYSVIFAQKIMTIMIDLTTKLSRGWSTPSCVAQELALKLLLDGVEVTLETYGLELADGWREMLEASMYEDDDHENLYDPSMDGFENDLTYMQHFAMAPMRFEDWFKPFTGRHVPPYVVG